MYSPKGFTKQSHHTYAFYCMLMLCFILFLSRTTLASKNPSKAFPASDVLSLAKAFHFFGNIEHDFLIDGNLSIKTGKSQVVGFLLPFDQKGNGLKLQFRFKKLKNFRSLKVYFAHQGESFPKAKRAFIHFNIPGEVDASTVYTAQIPKGNIHLIQLTFISRNAPAEAVLESITLRPLELWDSPIWPYVFAMGAGVLLLLPGAILYVLLHGNKASIEEFQIAVFAYSLVFYIIVYVFLVVVFAVHIPPPVAQSLTLIFCAIFLFVLLLSVSRKGLYKVFLRILRGSWQEIAVYILLIFGLCLTIVHDANLPLHNMYYNDIAGPKTFQDFRGHDGMFQYVNGLAIAENEPFSKYYAHHQLIYNVEDREILPGVVYAVFRVMSSPLPDTVARSYFLYTVFGVAMNLMLLFPLAALARRYLSFSRTFILLLLVSLNAFMVGNSLLTWFKFSGAALFFSGLYYLFKKEISYGDWVKSGLYFGLGANMHAGAALGIPLFFLWAVWRQLKRLGLLSLRTYAGPLLLVVLFAVTIVPWSMVKHRYFHDNYTLIKAHFLDGYSSPKGLAASAELFFSKTPLQNQVSKRLTQLGTSFRIKELVQLGEDFGLHNMKDFLYRWDKYEFNFLIFTLYPGIFFVLLAWLFKRSVHKQTWNFKSYDIESGKTMFILSILTMLCVTLAHFGPYPPDIVYHQPLAVLILANMVMITVILRSSMPVRATYYGYMAVVFYRLFLYL